MFDFACCVAVVWVVLVFLVDAEYLCCSFFCDVELVEELGVIDEVAVYGLEGEEILWVCKYFLFGELEFREDVLCDSVATCKDYGRICREDECALCGRIVVKIVCFSDVCVRAKLELRVETILYVVAEVFVFVEECEEWCGCGVDGCVE